MASQDWLEKDFYAVLGVSKDVSDADLRKAYRRLARKYHPDANSGDPSAEAKFKDITEAYTVLSDAEQRKEYDALKAMGSGARFSAGSGGAGAGGGQGFEDLFGGLFNGGAGQRVRYTTTGGPAGGQGFEDLLGGMFSGGGFGGRPRAVPGRDVSAEATLTFAQAVSGARIRISHEGHPVQVRIPVGVRDGQRVRVRGRGEPGPGGGPAGDLIVTVHVKPHPVFELDGRNLRVEVPITFAEAALGAVIEVPTYRGAPVKVRVRSGTQSGRELRVRGRGVQARKGTGDLLVRLRVVVPKRLNAKARRALEEFQSAESGEDPRAGLLERARA